MMKLSAKQLKAMQSIEDDKVANQNTLLAALAFNNEAEARNQQRHRDLWTELAEIHGLDIINKQYQILTVEGVAQIVELVREEKPE